MSERRVDRFGEPIDGGPPGGEDRDRSSDGRSPDGRSPVGGRPGGEGFSVFLCLALLAQWAITLAALVVVIPQFRDIFMGMRIELPLMTQAILQLSQALGEQRVLLAALAIVLPVVVIGFEVMLGTGPLIVGNLGLFVLNAFLGLGVVIPMFKLGAGLP